MFFEKSFSESPIDMEIFGKKARNNHTSSSMHPVRLNKLSHRSIDERVSSFSLTPFFKEVCILRPFDMTSFFLKFSLLCLRKIVSDMLPKFSPCEFRDKTFTFCFCLIIDLSDRKYSETNIRGEARSSIDIKCIPLCIIVTLNMIIKSFFSKLHRKIRMFWNFDIL